MPILFVTGALVNLGVSGVLGFTLSGFSELSLKARTAANYGADPFDLAFAPVDPDIVSDAKGDQTSSGENESEDGALSSGTPTPQVITTDLPIPTLPTLPGDIPTLPLPTLPLDLPTLPALLPTTVSLIPTAASIVPTVVSIIPTSVPIVPTVAPIVPTAVAIVPTVISILPTLPNLLP